MSVCTCRPPCGSLLLLHYSIVLQEGRLWNSRDSIISCSCIISLRVWRGWSLQILCCRQTLLGKTGTVFLLAVLIVCANHWVTLSQSTCGLWWLNIDHTYSCRFKSTGEIYFSLLIFKQQYLMPVALALKSEYKWAACIKWVSLLNGNSVLLSPALCNIHPGLLVSLFMWPAVFRLRDLKNVNPRG